MGSRLVLPCKAAASRAGVAETVCRNSLFPPYLPKSVYSQWFHLGYVQLCGILAFMQRFRGIPSFLVMTAGTIAILTWTYWRTRDTPDWSITLYVLLVLFVIALGIAVAGLRWWKTRDHPDWPTTEGTVAGYELESPGKHSIWVVAYSYSANGTFYAGRFPAVLPRSAEWMPSRPPLEQLYPKGMKLGIRFNAQDPAVSVPVSREPCGTPPAV